MVEQTVRYYNVILIFIVGNVLMGYEMVVSRFLYPYFGSGINTWAVLISTVLSSVAGGYFLGGRVAQRIGPKIVLAVAVVAAGVYMILVSYVVDWVLIQISAGIGDGFLGLFIGSSFITVVPIAFLGSLSPAFLIVFTKEIRHVGPVSGWIYALSTAGNVCGTLITSFLFIPQLGSRNIALLFGVTLVASGILFLASFRVQR